MVGGGHSSSSVEYTVLLAVVLVRCCFVCMHAIKKKPARRNAHRKTGERERHVVTCAHVETRGIEYEIRSTI